MHVGIDLGTTYCCMSYINADGAAKIIPNSDGELTTPSIIWFDGNAAMVGKKAENIKNVPGQNLHIYELIKREMGKPVETSVDYDELEIAPYEIGGFKYGAAGMSAIILRKLKMEALSFFKKRGMLDQSVQEKEYALDAVITVPAYFGDKERNATRLAGMAAGLNVIGIINEPTAAALTYGFMKKEKSKILVFDLGGGTFDVTIIEMNRGKADVIASAGHNTLGGKNWDHLIEKYLYNTYETKIKSEIPDDKGFHVQQKALDAKLALSDHEEVDVSLLLPEGDLEVTLYRENPNIQSEMDEFMMNKADTNFYFEQVSTDLLGQCKRICMQVLENSGLSPRSIDEVIMAGGSCRMPMIRKLLTNIFGERVRQTITGFSFDTAIAIGAALYGHQRGNVNDIVSTDIGVRYRQNGSHFIDHLITKDSKLPAKAERMYAAEENAVLAIYEGPTNRPDECSLRGRLELGNPAGKVKVILEQDVNGILKAIAEFPPDGRRELEIKNNGFQFDQRLEPLKEKVQSIQINR